MINYLVNFIIRKYTAFKFRKYQIYPTNSTAVLFVDCQVGFLEGNTTLKTQLELLKNLSIKCGWAVIQSFYKPYDNILATPAHLLLNEKIKNKHKSVFDINCKKSISLLPSSELSIFANEELFQYLKRVGIEHLILAGPMADLRLDSTMRDAVQNDFHVTVLRDVISLSSPKSSLENYDLTLRRYAQTVANLDTFIV